MRKKILSYILILVLLICAVPCYAASAAPDIVAENALLMDMTTNEVLYNKSSNAKIYPASTTKMMTCILALENMDLSEYITVEAGEIKGVGGTSLNLLPGEKMNVGTMISAMMVVSANDAAAVLANKMAGSIEGFADMMNAKAAELGCTGTHFVNPHGLDDSNHYSTCEDLAKIAEYCMQNEIFRRIVARGVFIVPETNLSKERQLANTNLLLNDESGKNRVEVDGVLRFCKYDGCIGIKTGTTKKAGDCLVSAATRGDTTLLCIVMNSKGNDRFGDSIKLLDWGFANFKTVKISVETTGASISVKGGKQSNITVDIPAEITVTAPKEASDSLLTSRLNLEEKLKAPVEAGSVVGSLEILNGDEVVSKYDLFANESVEQSKGLNGSIFKKVILIILIVLLVLIAIAAVYIIYKRKQIAKRKAARAQRRAELEKRDAALREEWEKSYRNRYRK